MRDGEALQSRNMLNRLAVGVAVATLALSASEVISSPSEALAGGCVTTVSPDGTTATVCSSSGGSATGGNTPSTPEAPTPTETTPAPPAPAPKPTTPKHKKKPAGGNNTSGNNTTVSHDYDYNMHAWGKYDNDCGVNAAADAVSFVKQRQINPDMTLPVMAPWYQNGRIKDFGNQPYMSGAAPQLAKQFNFEFKHVHSLEAARQAIKAGGAAIFLAVATSNSPITHASHYVESDQLIDGNLKFHDPNQTSTRHFDKSVHTIHWMRSHGILNQAWVMTPPNTSR